MIKKYFWKIFLVILLSMNNLYGKPEIVNWKVLSNDKFNVSDIASVGFFVDKDDKVFVEVVIAGRWEDYLLINNRWVRTDQYGRYLNGFVKDGKVHLVFRPDEQHIDIYAVDEDFVLENRVTIGDFPRYPGPIQVIYVPGDNNVSYLLGSRQQLPRNPVEFMRDVVSGGHGLYYEKPVLAEIEGQTLLKYSKIPYGGKIDESYNIKEVLTGKDKIHLLGFRTPKQLPYTSTVLHYAEYNTKKEKVVRTQNIYEKTPDFNKNDGPRNLYLEWSSYWHVSADNFNDDLFIVFSWHRFCFSDNANKVPIINMESTNSPIYYSQSNGKGFGDVEIIGNGILPLVRADSVGNVHVIWANSDGALVHKAKKGDKWGDEQIILDSIIDIGEVREGMRQGRQVLKNKCAEFDKDNNLNVVFTSNGKLVLAKVRLD